MTFTPGRSVGRAECFQPTLEIASGFPTRLRRKLENVLLLEVENSQVELCRGLSESLMVDHPVSAIYDPGIIMNLRNGSRQVRKRRYSDRDTAARCWCQFFDQRRERRFRAIVGRGLHFSNE